MIYYISCQVYLSTGGAERAFPRPLHAQEAAGHCYHYQVTSLSIFVTFSNSNQIHSNSGHLKKKSAFQNRDKQEIFLC